MTAIEVRECAACDGGGLVCRGDAWEQLAPFEERCPDCNGTGRIETPLDRGELSPDRGELGADRGELPAVEWARCEGCGHDVRMAPNARCPQCGGETISYMVRTTTEGSR